MAPGARAPPQGCAVEWTPETGAKMHNTIAATCAPAIRFMNFSCQPVRSIDINRWRPENTAAFAFGKTNFHSFDFDGETPCSVSTDARPCWLR
jgi:hypothetical protein